MFKIQVCFIKIRNEKTLHWHLFSMGPALRFLTVEDILIVACCLAIICHGQYLQQSLLPASTPMLPPDATEKRSWDFRASPTRVSEKVFLKKSLLWRVVCELWSGGCERDPLHLWIAFPCIKHFNCVVRFRRLLLTGRKEKGMEENRLKRKHCHKTWTGVAPERRLSYLPLNTRRLDVPRQ